MRGWSLDFAPQKGIDLLNPFVAYWAGSGDYGESAASLQTLVDISGNGRNANQPTTSLRPQFAPGDVPGFVFNNSTVKMPVPIVPANMNGRDWSLYFRLTPLSLSGFNPILSGGANAASQTFLILLQNAIPSYSQHSVGYLTTTFSATANVSFDMLFTHTAAGANTLYVNDKVNTASWAALNVGSTYPIVLGNYYAYSYTSQFKLNRFAFWQRIITATEFGQLKAEE